MQPIVQQSPGPFHRIVRSDEEVAVLFHALADQWKHDARLLSDQTAIVTHPAYYRIIGLGWQVLPLILNDLAQGGGPWFVALEAITGETPAPTPARPNARQLRAQWIEWGKTHGYLPYRSGN